MDLSRPPALHAELERLVREVLAATSADETDFLEWKSRLDCASKHGHIHMARAILSFANRMPDVAERAFAGHAYLVVGAEPASLLGVELVDTVQLEQGIVRYVGDDGPRWHPTWLLIDGKHVLVIDVDPPRWGDRPHAARTTSENINDGDVFVRGKGGNKRATSAQHKALLERALRTAKGTPIDIAVSLESPTELTPLNYASDDWIAHERERLLAPMYKARDWTGVYSPGSNALFEAAESLRAIGSQMVQREDRTESDYILAVDGYLRVCEQRFRRVLDIAASRALEPVVLTVMNSTPRNLPGLELVLHVPGRVEAVALDEKADDDGDSFPRAPRSWGPQPTALARSLTMGPLAGFTVPSVGALGPRYFIPKPVIENGGSVKITFPDVDLRPHGGVRLDPIVLVIDERPGTTITAAWSATSTGADGEARGELLLPIATTAKSLKDLEESDQEH